MTFSSRTHNSSTPPWATGEELHPNLLAVSFFFLNTWEEEDEGKVREGHNAK